MRIISALGDTFNIREQDFITLHRSPGLVRYTRPNGVQVTVHLPHEQDSKLPFKPRTYYRGKVVKPKHYYPDSPHLPRDLTGYLLFHWSLLLLRVREMMHLTTWQINCLKIPQMKPMVTQIRLIQTTGLPMMLYH